MVRFKNRHILVEFLDVSSMSAFPPSVGAPKENEEDDEDEDILDDAEDEVAPLPSAPFMLSQATKPLLADDTGAIYKAVRTSVQDVFGDEGWGRIGSSFKVIYHSPLTTLTIMRVARPHYRLLWGGVTLLRDVDGTPVLPRVVAVSGTIKKLQSAAIVHHRRNTAAAVASLVAQGAKAEADKERLVAKIETEREALARLEE